MKSVKKLIMLILFLLVALFMAGMGLMSSLNLSYSQEAMSALRTRQIEDAFHANLDRIDAHHRLMEKNTEALARLGEVFHRLRGQTGPDGREPLEAALAEKIRDFPEASGGGIWFDPGAYGHGGGRFAAYAAWRGGAVEIVPGYGGPAYDYPDQAWFKAALPPDWDRSRPRPERFYWSAAYYDELADAVLVTVAAFMHDAGGRIIGLATTNWRADEIIRLVSGVDVTPGSFSFLIDEHDRKLSSLSRTGDTLAAQTLLGALSARELMPADGLADALAGDPLHSPMLRKALKVDEREYALFFSNTRAGMVFGVGVPQDEIDSVLQPMRESNFRIAAATGLALLLLSGIVLYVVASIMRLLETLYTDPLTGLPNRARLLSDANETPNGSLVLIDIDSFKEINDFYGNQCGDYILRCVARELRTFLEGDAYCAGGLLYKLPADGFAVLVSAAPGPGVLEACLKHFSAFTGSRVFRWEGQEIGVSVTLGAAAAESLGAGGSPGERFLSSANIALKLARIQHRHYTIYDPALRVREQYERNLQWAKRLKAALHEDRIVPYFQPIPANRGDRLPKFECLVRLMDKDDEPVGPAQFLEVAKRLRLYPRITRIMVEKSIAAFRDTPYEFSLNLSYEDLADAETTAFITRRLRESGIGERVIFEILESEGIQNYQAVRLFIDEVKALGCRIAIDDFGSGYSNFEHLLRLDADIIKIDGSLIRNLDSDGSAWIVTRGIVQFARELGMQTVAEFVHSADIQSKVIELGIDYSQGAHFGMPAPEPAIRQPAPTRSPRGEETPRNRPNVASLSHSARDDRSRPTDS